MTQDLNEQFINPELQDIQEPLAGPSEASLFELDALPKADKSKFEEELSTTADKQTKEIFDAFAPIATEERVTAFMDDKGNMYEQDSPAVKETALQTQLPDPPTEEQKKAKEGEIKTKMQDEIDALGMQADELIQLGGLAEKRRDKYIQKNTEQIQAKYKQEYDDFVKGVVTDYTKKNKTEKQALATINDVSSAVQAKILDADNAILGLDLSKVSTYSKNNINPEMEEKYKETLGKGISTYEQFTDAFEKGKIENGAVLRIYDAWGYKSNVMTTNATPVYYQAIVGADGKKSIEKVAEGAVDPVTGQVIGAIAPISNMSPVPIDLNLIYVSKVDELKREVEARTDLTADQKIIKVREIDAKHNEGLNKVSSAYDATMSPYNNLSKAAKLAILASTYPNEFKQKYSEAFSEGLTGETASDRVLKAFGGILVSPITATTMAVGAVETGVKEASRLIQGKPEGVLPTGTLALEIQKNPKLAEYIDEVVKEAGPLANQYLNSVEGLANLVSSAKAKMNNKDIESIISQARTVYPKIQEALQGYANTANRLKVNASSYEAGALRILNQSGYNAALNDYRNAVNALANSDDKDVRDAYKFIKLQSNMLNADSEETATERFAKLKPEEVEFINKIGKELQLNKRDKLGSVYDEVKKIYELGKMAQGLFPSAELKDYKQKNEPGLLSAIEEYKQQFELIKGSEIFSEKGKFILGRLNELDDEYNSAFSDTRMYSFPALSQDEAVMKNALAYINPAYGLGVGVLNGIGDILGGLRETGQKLSGFSWDNFDANSRNISYSLGEYKKYLETVGETGNYAFDISKSIGEAFPQMVGFAGSFIVGGPIGGASYLAATMTGPKMREAAAAGLGDMGQATYAILSMGLEYGSELVTSETALFRAGKGKSVLTKELVEKIMTPKTRKEAFKEYANLLWKKGAKTAWSGTLEAFEEEIANKGNYLLQSFYNGMMNTSFNPSAGTAQESLDTLITMIGTSALFKGVTKLKQMTAERTPIEAAKKELVKQGMDKTNASIMAALTTNMGIARALDIVKKVESGQIKESELDMPVYERVRDVLIPAAMSANFSPGTSIEQRTVAMDNMIKADEISRMLESGQVTENEAATAIQAYTQNAQTALRDVEYAKKEFGIDGTAMRDMAYQYFGLADITTNQNGALDARTPEQMQVSEMDMTPLDREGFIGKLNEIYVENENNAAVRRVSQNAIANNPEGFVASEIQSTKNLIEKAKADYELASKQGPASMQLARIDDLNDRLTLLENTKSRYLNSQQYATEVSTGPQQEVGQPSNLIQPPGVEQGQQEIGQGEGGVGQAAQPTADARNRNFGSQAKQAFGQVRQMMQDAGVSSVYMQPIMEGQELDYMDELASQVMENQPAVERQFGQAVVDRVNKYIADTGLDSDVFAVRSAQQRVTGNRVNEARNALIEAINQSNAPANTANKSAVKTLVDRLKKAFPNVKVIMDKKGFQAALKDEAARDLMTKGGVVYGRVLNGDVYLNPDYANYNTPIHEFGHLWLNAAKEIAPAVYNRGRELIRDSEYMAKLQADPLYEGLSSEEMENEALATAIGDRGEQFVNDVQKQGFRNWVRRLIGKLSQYVGIFNLSKVELDLLTLDEFLNRANASLLAGEAVTFNKMSDRGTMFEVKALHGSPYSFGKFTTEKIGTGEGNQAFGWGLYFTQLKDIATKYAKAGQLAQLDNYIGDYQLEGEDVAEQLFNYVQAGGEISEWIKSRESKLKNWQERITAGEDLRGTTMENIVERLEFSINSAKEIQSKISRNLYNVTLQKGKQPSEYTWLEWDKPISDKALSVFEKFNKQNNIKLAEPTEPVSAEDRMNGSDLYKWISSKIGDKQASLFLLENGIDGVKYPAESISKGKTSETARGFNYVVFDENAVEIEQQTQFMARQQEPSFKKQMIDLANAVMQRELSKGRTLEEARTIATSEVSAAVIANATGKFNNNAVQKQIENYVGEAYNERKIAEQAAARQRRISQAYTTPETQKILADANRSAQDIADSNKGKKAKVTAKQAYDTVLAQVKAGIDRMYANGTIPAGVSWIDMMSLAPAIASDSVRVSFPAANRQRFEGEDMVTMSTSQLIREAIKAQARTAGALNYTAKEVNAIFKALLSQMTQQFGGGLQLSPSAVRAITKSIQDNIFSNASVLNVSENAAEEISKILEKAYRGKLAEETKKLLDKIAAGTFKAQFIQVYAQQLRNLTGENIDSTVDGIINSNASLEDIARLNSMLKGVTSTKEGQRERRVDYIAPALNALASITPTAQQQVDNKYESLLTKIKGLIAKATGPNAQSISSLDYEQMLNLMHSMEDVENRRNNISSLTPEQQAEILKQYGILKLSPLGDIQQYVQTRENEIKRDTALLVDSINQQKRTEASKIREKIPNQLLYNQFLNFMGNLDSEYLSSLSPKELLDLKSALNDIVNNGNYNKFAYDQYIKSWQYKIRNEFRNWATYISANRDRITRDGFSNMFKNKFKDFAKTFGSVEGSVPSADLIEKAFDLLFFHQMDVELNTGFDEVGMGFLERELFGQLSVATDQALNKTQSNLAPLQEAMVALSDKSNRSAIKKAVGNLWKTYGIKDSLMFKRLMTSMRRDVAGGMYDAISVRMAAIVANQIDHISNLREGDERIDMVLQRNILESKNVGQTFKEFFSATSLNSKFKDFDAMVDHIAYAALTENGTKTLKDYDETKLLSLLTPMQRAGISRWREYINSNQELFEATQVITGKMNPSLKNYIPRNVLGTGDITQIDDVEVYINGQVQTGISQQQLESRMSDTGKLNLNLNKVLLNNAKTLNTLYYAKPFLDAVKGMGEAIEDIKSGNVAEQRPLSALMAGGETLTDANQFALAYAEGVKNALASRVKNTLLSNEKSVADNFDAMFRVAAKTQAFAAKMWLLSPLRQLNDFFNNFLKTAAVLAFESKNIRSVKSAMRAFIPQKAYSKTDKGKFKWEDYVNIADYTGSPIYKMMSMYADNFIYEFRKTPEQLQRQQRAASWQDMAYKKIVWMDRFEQSFYKLTGEYFDHEAFKDARGSYRAMYATTVQRASLAADSLIDKQYGLASVARQPLRIQAILAPILGARAIRNTFGKNYGTFKVGSTGAMLTGFMQGYATRQYALVQSYAKRAFDTTTTDTPVQRLTYLTRALTEAVIPVYGYSLVRTITSNLFTSVSAAIRDAFDDDEEQKKMFNELETKSGWERFKKKTELAFVDLKEDALDNLINSAYSLTYNPQAQFVFKNVAGLLMFQFYKKKAVEDMRGMGRAEVKQAKKDIKSVEQKMFGMFNMKMINIYGGDEYNESVKMFYNADEAVTGWENTMESFFGFSALSQVAGQTTDFTRLMTAAEGANVNKGDVALAAGLQLYGILFANMYAPGGIGTVMSMLSGDATKAGRYIMGEQMRVLKDYNWDHRKEKPRQMIIYPGEKKGKMPGGGSPYGGGGAYGGKGAYGGGGAY